MPKKHYAWKLGEPLPKIGAHSLAKHQVFERYINRYINIVAPHPAQRGLNLTIVDGYCGGGRYAHKSGTVLHLSTRERARDEMARLHWEMTNTFVHYGKAGFNALGYDPDIDPDQQSLEFNFGSNARADSINAAVEQLPKFIRDDTSGKEEPVTIGELFRARCNDTPLTMPLVGEAVVRLRDDLEEVEVLTSDGKIRPKARKLSWDDRVRPRKQRTFYRGFGSKPQKK